MDLLHYFRPICKKHKSSDNIFHENPGIRTYVQHGRVEERCSKASASDKEDLD